MQENKIVLDANIWISYFLSNRYPDLFEYAKRGIIFYRCDELTYELERVLRYPKFKNKFKMPIEEYMLFYTYATKHVDIELEFTACPDEKDNYLVDLAIQSKAKYLVTGDKVVLATPVKPPLQVITLTDFKKIFS